MTRWLPRRFASTRAQRQDPATGLFGQRGRWDAAKQRRWIAQQERNRQLVLRDGDQPDAADMWLIAVAFTAGALITAAILLLFARHWFN